MYKGSSSFEAGTMMQLRNLVNRRNVSKDVTGRFNAALDFYQLVTECHILAASVAFFGMTDIDSTPSCNIHPNGIEQ